MPSRIEQLAQQAAEKIRDAKTKPYPILLPEDAQRAAEVIAAVFTDFVGEEERHREELLELLAEVGRDTDALIETLHTFKRGTGRLAVALARET